MPEPAVGDQSVRDGGRFECLGDRVQAGVPGAGRQQVVADPGEPAAVPDQARQLLQQLVLTGAAARGQRLAPAPRALPLGGVRLFRYAAGPAQRPYDPAQADGEGKTGKALHIRPRGTAPVCGTRGCGRHPA